MVNDESMNADNPKRWLEYRHKITFIETNAVGNVYFSHYFALMGKARDVALEQFLPDVETYLKQGFGLITEYAHIDFAHEGRLYDALLIRMGCLALSRTRIEFEFELVREKDSTCCARGVAQLSRSTRSTVPPSCPIRSTMERWSITALQYHD